MPNQVGNESNWKEVHAGQGHSIGIKEDSTIWAWGFNTYGQLGIGNTINQSSPVQIGNLHDWLTASCGGGHTLALKADSTLWAFGYNGTGPLGDSTTIQSNVPIQIGPSHQWTSISAGFEFSLARKADGTIWSWGFNANGQLGIGNTTTSLYPVQIGVNNNWALIEAGSSFGFAINTNGELFGWGFNTNGQLGIGTTNDEYYPIQEVGLGTNWNYISGAAGAVNAGSVYGTHSLGLQGLNFSICATGSNYVGQLGDNTTTQSNFFNCSTGDLNVGLVEMDKSDFFTAMPNPSNGLFTINTETLNSSSHLCNVLDATGKEVYRNYFNTEIFQIDLQELSSGVYIIILENEGLSVKKRVVIE